ncbi:MAG: CBS domain-containing protein [Pyrinomonadaceae bacterium]|nr:CBS domain-containing protein [Pyrinomonadaceae bacterium]
MKVQEIMTREVGYCGPKASLADVAKLMWDKDCGAIPVVDAERKVIGMLTDRDICMAVATRNRLASEMQVGEVLSGTVVRACAPSDDAEAALDIMRQSRLRRLPVIGEDGTLQGILSITDLVLHTKGDGKKGDHLSRKRIIGALKAICEPPAAELSKEKERALGMASL